MKNKKIYLELTLILVALILLAFVDFVVLELILHPTTSQFQVPWDSLNTNFSILGNQFSIFTWWIAFLPLALSIFIIIGITLKSWKFLVSGIILFATGWEDIFYYLIQGRWLPSELSWLDPSPLITLSRFITQTEHVTSLGVLISAIVGVIIVFFIFSGYNLLKKFLKK